MRRLTKKENNYMAKSITTIKSILFDITNPKSTDVEVIIIFDESKPIQTERIYKNTFSAEKSIVEILNEEVVNCVGWGESDIIKTK